MRSRMGIVALALALLLALAPAAPALDGPAAPPAGAEGGGIHQALKYIACAGGIVFMVIAPASVFYTAILCAEAMLDN